jgi:hypothetical protein
MTPEGSGRLLRAAVLSTFDVEQIEPRLAEIDVDDLADFLASSCERVVDATGTPRWRLRDDERVRVLRGQSTAALLGAVDSVATRPDEPVQAVLEQYLHGELPPVGELSPSALGGVLQLERWFGADAGLPRAQEVQSRLDWAEIAGPLERLLARGFVGRSDLLAELRSFIEDGPQETEFVLYGVGGSGKSTVLARLIDELTRAAVPVAYVTYDRGWLIDGGPFALFDEIVRQLATQVGDLGEQAARLRRQAETTGRRTGFADIASRGSQSRVRVPASLLTRLAKPLTGQRRVLVVLDTFEEMERRELSRITEVFGFLRGLGAELPGLRVVVAGRTPVQVGGTRLRAPWRLSGLGEADALRLLRELVAEPDSELLGEVVRLVGGNPLSLRLAADVLNRSGGAPVRLLSVAEGNVQGQLYSRLLEHIADPRVRAIAHPGLVVRRLTPEVIREVLAEPCGIAPLDAYEEQHIFWGLAREATLCEPSPDGDGALVQRQDVRALMLPFIQLDNPGTIRRIHEAAVRYYESAPPEEVSAGVARREELYHRLMLKQEPPQLDERWQPAAGADLAAVIDELPARAQLYLTTKVRGLRLDPEVRATADDHEWRHSVEPAVRARIERGLLSEALELLRERRGADGRALLPVMEIEVLERLGWVTEALGLVAAERENACRRGSLTTMRELITHEARILERLSRWEAAMTLLGQLAGLDRERRARNSRLDDDVRVRELVVLTSMLRIARHQGRDDPEIEELRNETAELAGSTPGRLLTGIPSLLRDLAAEIGLASPGIMELAVATLAEPSEEELSEEPADLSQWSRHFSEAADLSQDYLDHPQEGLER